jgi:hypothetical protein
VARAEAPEVSDLDGLEDGRGSFAKRGHAKRGHAKRGHSNVNAYHLANLIVPDKDRAVIYLPKSYMLRSVCVLHACQCFPFLIDQPI